MSKSSDTISCRVPKGVYDQVQEIATAEGQTISDWVRPLILAAVHAATGSAPSERAEEPPKALTENRELLWAIEALLNNVADDLRKEIRGVREAVTQAEASLAELSADYEAEAQDHLMALFDRRVGIIVAAIGRLKQSQRSHKDTLLQALEGRGDERPGYGSY